MRIVDFSKSYEVSGNRIQVLDHLQLDLSPKGITVLLGRSGCGKTTLLRLIAGLEQPDEGVLKTGNEGEKAVPHGAIPEEHSFLGARSAKRTDRPLRVGMVFQEPRLMPWLNVADNIAFSMRQSGKEKLQIMEKCRELMKMTGLEGFADAYPSQLSGGMQQRTALARALGYEPELLLMDEPFAALDYFTRGEMQSELLRICRERDLSVLFVTHSLDEALILGSRIMILKEGQCHMALDLQEEGYPRDLLAEPFVSYKKELQNKYFQKGGFIS